MLPRGNEKACPAVVKVKRKCVMSSYNRVILMGNLTRDVEVKFTTSGIAIGKMGLAVNDRVKKGGEWVDEVMFVDCTLFGKTAENAGEYLSKGSPVFVEGRLKFEQWEKDGTKHSKHVVNVDKLQFLSSGKGGAKQSSESSSGDASGDEDVPF